MCSRALRLEARSRGGWGLKLFCPPDLLNGGLLGPRDSTNALQLTDPLQAMFVEAIVEQCPIATCNLCLQLRG